MSRISLSRLSNLLPFLQAEGIKAKKSLSQNFLVDGNIINKLIDAARLEPSDTIIEIGAGPGAITERLLDKAQKIIAIELDRDFARLLKRFPIEVIEGDALLYNYYSQGRTKIISNLPFQITAPLLALLLPKRDTILSLTFIVQKEFAERMCAKPGSKIYGTLSLLCQFYADISYIATISKNCFYPKPNVDSSIVHLVLREPPDVDPDDFFHLIHTAFRQRRKMLRASLKEHYTNVEKLTERPERLSLNDFLTLFAQVKRIQKK